MIKTIFNKKFWKYFFITLLVVEVVMAISVPFEYFDEFLYRDTIFWDACRLCLLTISGMLTESIVIAVAYASFFAFRNLPSITKTKAFLKTLAIGFVCFIPLSIAVYAYDLYVQPHIKVRSVEIVWKMRSQSQSESSCEFKNSTPALSTAKTLSQEIKSLRTQIADIPETDDNYYNIAFELDKYRIERCLRMVMALNLLISYLLFASTGYFSRNQTVKKILGVLAVIIVAVALLSSVKGKVKQYMKNTETEFKSIRSSQRR